MTTTITEATPVGFPDPSRDGFDRHYNVWVADISDGGEMLLLGHVPLRQAVAVGNRYARSMWQHLNLADSYGNRLADVASWVRWRWAVRSNRCGVCERGGDPWYCWCSQGDWFVRWVDGPQPDAVPVTVITPGQDQP